MTEDILPGTTCPICGNQALSSCQCKRDGRLYHRCGMKHDWCCSAAGITIPAVAPCHREEELPAHNIFQPKGDPRWN